MFVEWIPEYKRLIDNELIKAKEELFEMYQDWMDEVPLDVKPVEKRRNKG